MSGVTTSSLSLATSLRNWVILDYEEPNGQMKRPWAPFLLSLLWSACEGMADSCLKNITKQDSQSVTRLLLENQSLFTLGFSLCYTLLGIVCKVRTQDPENTRQEERRLMHLVPAPAVRLMKRRVLSRPGVNSLVHPRLDTSLFSFSLLFSCSTWCS